MRRARDRSEGASGERGFTLIELLVGMSMSLIVTLVAFSMLEFTTKDVSRTTERVHVDQLGRVALERLMIKLHSGCVAPLVTPVQSKSTGSVLRFISETGEGPSISSVTLHQLTYTKGTATTEGTIVEKTWKSLSTSSAPKFTFNESETPTTTRLLTGVRQTTGANDVGETEELPIFRYYRYYREGDHSPEGGEPTYGELKKTAINFKPNAEVPLTEEEAGRVARITISFTLAPEGKESTSLGSGRPVAFEDSAILRVGPSSTSSTVTNLPCATQT